MQANIPKALQCVGRYQAIFWLTLTCLLLPNLAARADLLLRYTFDEGSGPALDSGAAPATNGTFTGQVNGPKPTHFLLILRRRSILRKGQFVICVD
jgi:hypothetical protein